MTSLPDKLFSCPWCSDVDFDLYGLKLHIQRWCPDYDNCSEESNKEADVCPRCGDQEKAHYCDSRNKHSGQHACDLHRAMDGTCLECGKSRTQQFNEALKPHLGSWNCEHGVPYKQCGSCYDQKEPPIVEGLGGSYRLSPTKTSEP